jgi:putative zinc finger/helix-turn-helix YgiT family protein
VECPNQHDRMEVKSMVKEVSFRGKRIKFSAQHFVCPECGIEADDLDLAATNQKALSDAYRSAVKLLTGEQIVEGRKKLKWTQEELAKAANVGIASIKRWETGQIQTKAMDDVLRRALSGEGTCGDAYGGNRQLLRSSEDDKLLYSAKYLWYADMIAFRETGQSMTGAAYAALPHGPQLNNYTELTMLIKKANEDEAEPLTDHEERIIARIAKTFPGNQTIYRAVHEEQAYKSRKNGERIPYADADSITGV